MKWFWILWIALAAWAAGGLRAYRVSNSLEAWMPDLAAPPTYRSYVVIGVPTARASAAAVATRLRVLPEVAFCIDPVAARIAARAMGTSPVDFVVSRDGAYNGVFCFAHPDADAHAFLTDVRRTLNELGVAADTAIGGPIVFQEAMDRWSQDRLPLILAGVLIGGGLTLFVVTGSILLTAHAIAAIALSEVIFLGIVCRLGIPIDMSVALVPPTMTALGCSYAAHRALRRRSMVLLITCGLAAAAGISSYATADLKPVRDFAWAGVPGVALVWLVTVTLVSPHLTARRRHSPWMNRLRNLTLRFNDRHTRSVVIVAAVTTAAGIVLAPGLLVESNPMNFFPRDSQVVRDFDVLNQRLTGMMPSQVMVGRRDSNALPILAATPGMRKVLDVTAWTGGRGRTYLCLADNGAVEPVARAWPDWQQWATDHGTTLTWHGIAPQIHRSGLSIRRLSAAAVPSMALLVGVVVMVFIRKWQLVILAVWVALLPVAALVMGAVVLRCRLDPVTLVIGSITTGVAVDDTLHLLGTMRRRGSIRRGVIESWRPCVGSSFAASVCFGCFTLSRFGPTAQFGILMAAATLLAMISNQVVLPSAAALLGYGRGNKVRTMANSAATG